MANGEEDGTGAPELQKFWPELSSTFRPFAVG